MMQPQEIYLGIDFHENSTQVCFSSEQIPEPSNVLFENGMQNKKNPFSLSLLLSSEETENDLTLVTFVEFLQLLIDSARQQAGCNLIAKICFTMQSFELQSLTFLAKACEKIGLSQNQCLYLSHSESYAYYAYSQKKEQYATGVLLLDLGSDGLHSYGLVPYRKNGVDYIVEDKNFFDDDDFVAAGTLSKQLEQIDETLEQVLAEIVKKHLFSSIYLTGPGFDVNEFPSKMTHLLCRRSRVFAGQNLFVKGACFCAALKEGNDLFETTILACENRTAVGIEMEILEHGKPKRLRLVKPGINWYMIQRNMDFILDDTRQIPIVIRYFNGKPDRTENLDLSAIPFREGKMTRIGMELKFKNDRECLFTIQDKGFGEFVRSSGTVLEQKLEL